MLSLVLLIVSIITMSATNVFAAEAPKNTGDLASCQELWQKMVQAKDQDINVFLAKLSPQDQKLAMELLKVTKIETNTSINNGGLNALTTIYETLLTTTVEAKNLLGATLWRYEHRITWDWDGTYIVSNPQWTISGTTYVIGWRYAGVVSSNTWGGYGQTYYRAYSQGHFILGIGGWDIENDYPWIDNTVYGAGGSVTYSGW